MDVSGLLALRPEALLALRRPKSQQKHIMYGKPSQRIRVLLKSSQLHGVHEKLEEEKYVIVPGYIIYTHLVLIFIIEAK